MHTSKGPRLRARIGNGQLPAFPSGPDAFAARIGCVGIDNAAARTARLEIG